MGQIGPSAALVVLAALSFARYTIVTKPLLAKYRPIEVTTYALVAGAVPFLVFAPGAMGALADAPARESGPSCSSRFFRAASRTRCGLAR